MASESPSPRQIRDGVTVLRRLIAPCDNGATEHAWRKCVRCQTMHLIQMRDPLVVRLLEAVIAAQEKPDGE